jgi:transposase
MASKTVEDVLFPGIAVRVEGVCDSSGILVVEAMSAARPGGCPDCRKQARRTHSSYQRDLNERPLGSHQVIVRLRVRRYFCDRKSCSRKTLVEQVPGLSERHRRSSTGLTGWLRSIAIELGGRPAARLCRSLRLAAGRTRLLRLLTAPTVTDRAPRVLGVDEFAFRKGCTCPVRPQCTASATRPRALALLPTRELHEIQMRNRLDRTTEEWQHRYAIRAGIEATLSQNVRAHGLRRSRYRGLAKTHVQHVHTAACNVARIADWMNTTPTARRRTSHFRALCTAAA